MSTAAPTAPTATAATTSDVGTSPRPRGAVELAEHLDRGQEGGDGRGGQTDATREAVRRAGLATGSRI